MLKWLFAPILLLLLSGCTANQHAAYLNYVLGKPQYVVCYWNVQDGRTYSNEAFTSRCQASAGQQLNIVMAINQDDDIEWYRDKCNLWGDTMFGVVVSPEHDNREEWVCYNVDF